MVKIKSHIPNTLTCLNLVSGCIAVVMALEGSVGAALVWIIIAAVFDFSDGFAARLLKAFSPIGKELDSLADVVSFGVAPGMMLFSLLKVTSASFPWVGAMDWIPYLAFMTPAFSGLRLAKFNIDTRQETSFIGLPVPANALLLGATVYSIYPFAVEYNLLITFGLILLSFATSLLLVSEIPMFSLKVKSFVWKGNEQRYVLVCAAVLLISLLGVLGLSFTILLYIFLSIFNNKR